LEAALRALRALKVAVLWIDALCINQKDPIERGLQVMRMGLIYLNASKVLAWIGDDADDSEMAMAYLQNPRKRDGSNTLTRAFSALFRRPYWKRAV
jgi:Heterokaryon incompatibility protein (HET)